MFSCLRRAPLRGSYMEGFQIPTSCVANINGADRQCCLETGVCTASTCSAVGLSNGQPLDKAASQCKLHVENCGANGETCFGQIVCKNGKEHCPGKDQFCLVDASRNVQICTALPEDKVCQQVKCLGTSVIRKDGVTRCPKGAILEPCTADLCDGVKCLNGGRCEKGTCVCKPGFSGEDCATDDRCKGVTCPDGKACKAGDCVCPKGLCGSRCQHSVERGGRSSPQWSNPVYKKDVDACQKACNDSSSCDAWTLYQSCLLLDITKGSTSRDSTFSALKGESAQPNVAQKGLSYASFPNMDQEDCQRACERDARCKAWNHASKCYIGSDTKPNEDDALSGLK